ncbi:hypothetical protein L2649_12920 [Thermoactinomyces vulgaris]|jgi:tetratricopeptide (TPR) repeat protein|uniref:tetratricopeptide repeat protein n=1 Tax=Thermoactinomyces vulgaris TaxID=2026 RepID=UPI0010406D0C|nr:hypothetical protein [Thermoactinomyces vulgaris]MCF6136056.1 hypothetical protein [Thermoactinomyces vulgaris]QBK12723.1 hypothetical protein AB849_003170 [Thermoactinomyces vulgaris]
MDSSLAEKIIKLSKKGAHEEEIERFLDQHVAHHSDDVEAWIRLGVLVFEPPIGDFEKSVNCLRKAVELKPDCLEALLILMRMQYTAYAEIDEDVYQLLHHYQPRSREEQSLIEFAKAWYFECKKMDEEYVRHLEKSITVYPKYVLNYIALGNYYEEKGQKEKAKSLFLKGMKNVRQIYRVNGGQDPLVFDYHEYINEKIKGIHLSSVTYKLIKEGVN